MQRLSLALVEEPGRRDGLGKAEANYRHALVQRERRSAELREGAQAVHAQNLAKGLRGPD